MIITSLGAIHTFGLEQTGQVTFNIGLIGTVQLPMLAVSNLYVCPLNETQLFISNYPLDGDDFIKD